jgi:hypothetical protein
VFLFLVLLDEAEFETIDAYKILITFPEPDGVAFVKFSMFFQIAHAFSAKHNSTKTATGTWRKPVPGEKVA